MLQFSLCAVAPVAVMMAAAVANAQNGAGHCSQCQASYAGQGGYVHDSCYDNAIWPRQYVAPSRRGICQAFDLTIANGWRRNNLLGKYDFAPNGEGLSEAGRLRVEWILTQAPPHRRTIFVQRGADQAETSVRVEAVQALASTVNPSIGAVDVQETDMRDYGRPAASVDAVFTGFVTNQPPPVLPASNAPGTGEGS